MSKPRYDVEGRPGSRQRESVNPPGSITLFPESKIGRRGKRSRLMLLPKSQLHISSATVLSYFVRNALNARTPAPCIVYDAEGKPIAQIDPETRERTPINNK